MITISMKQLLEAGVHYGHLSRSWNPSMAPYIYGARHKQHIINLEYTVEMLSDMLKFVYNVASKRGKVLFVGTKPQAGDIIREEATRCGMPYVNYRWLGGMLTNYKTIRQSIKRLKELEEQFENENFEGLTKKERLNLMREKTKLSNVFSGIKDMGGLPDAIFIIDVGHENIAIAEANRLQIPVAGIVDTNCKMDGVTYPVPGNDDAIRAIRLYCKSVADTILQAKEQHQVAERSEANKAATKEPVVKKVIKRKTKTVVKTAADKAEDADAVAEPAAKKTVRKTANKAKKAEAEVKDSVPKAPVAGDDKETGEAE